MIDILAVPAWVPVCVALAIVGAAALPLWRKLRRLARHAASSEGEIERLRDEIWQARESEERYRGLIEGQNDLIARRDSEGCIVYANAAFLEAAGRDETILGSVAALPVTATSAVSVTADGTRGFDQEIEAGGGRRWISWIETMVREADGRMVIQAVGRDITERHLAEEAIAAAHRKAEAASAAKSRFLATVSHELRTPLSGILGMADLLMDTPLSPEQATYARAAKSSGESLLFLIDEILDFSKIESGKLELARESFDLTALIEGVVELLAPRAQGKGVEIASFIAPSTQRQLVGDPARLRQILINLAGNAVKFTAKGGVGLSVATSPSGHIVFTVADTGPGIAPDKLARIFEEFEQGEGGQAGAGLGLAISRRLVQMMGGTLTVDSALGRGATFTADVPLPARPDAPAAPRAAFLAGSRALVVARSPFEAPFLCERLRSLGLDIDQAAGQSDALALLSNSSAPDLLVVDAAIGEDCARAISTKAAERGTSSKLLLLSPFERRQFGTPAAFGFNGYLVKPIRERSLAARLFGPSAPEPRGASGPMRRPADPPSSPLRVLLAEDDEVNALIATRLLERAGASVERHDNGTDALDAALRALDGACPPFDLALLDIRMPGLDGHEVAGKLRAMERRLKAQPLRLVALTANAFPEDRESARAAGFDAFLVKPILREDLLRLLAPDDSSAKVA